MPASKRPNASRGAYSRFLDGYAGRLAFSLLAARDSSTGPAMRVAWRTHMPREVSDWLARAAVVPGVVFDVEDGRSVHATAPAASATGAVRSHWRRERRLIVRLAPARRIRRSAERSDRSQAALRHGG